MFDCSSESFRVAEKRFSGSDSSSNRRRAYLKDSRFLQSVGRPLRVVIGVRQADQKILLAVKNMGGETEVERTPASAPSDPTAGARERHANGPRTPPPAPPPTLSRGACAARSAARALLPARGKARLEWSASNLIVSRAEASPAGWFHLKRTPGPSSSASMKITPAFSSVL